MADYPPEVNQDYRPAPAEPVTGSGWLAFAGILLLLIGVFKMIEGLWALWSKHFRADWNPLMYVFNLSAWGWIHLILGIVLIVTGIGVLAGQEWARGLGIGLAAAAAVLQLLYLPYSTAALLDIGLCVLVIYALVVPKPGAIAN